MKLHRCRRIGMLLLSTLLLLGLCGCWSRRELNDISIVVGMGIDQTKSGYLVSVQVVNPSQVTQKKSSSGSFSPVVSYQSKGKSIPEALSRMSLKAARELYLSHLRILILGEDIARSGLTTPMDFIARNRELRTDFYLVIAKNATAAQILDMYSPIDPIPANSLYTKLDTSDNVWSATGKVTLDRLIQDLAKEGKGPALTTIEVVGNKNQGSRLSSAQNIDPSIVLRYDGMAAFKFDRMAGWLDENDARALNLIQNSTHLTTLTAPCPKGEGLLTMQLYKARAVITAVGPDEFNLVLRTQQDIADIGCHLDITDPSVLSDITRIVNEQLESMLNKSIRKTQKELKVDIFGFGDALHRQHPKAWSRIEDWDQIYAKAKIKVHAVTTIRRIGTTIKSMRDETKS